jgi:hypothetical protein
VDSLLLNHAIWDLMNGLRFEIVALHRPSVDESTTLQALTAPPIDAFLLPQSNKGNQFHACTRFMPGARTEDSPPFN